MRILLLTHYYPPEIGAAQRRWDALVSRFVAAGHHVTVLAPVPHYPSGRRGDDDARVFRTSPGRHGEDVRRVPYVPGSGSNALKLADQLASAAGSIVSAPGTRPDVVVATVPGLPTLAAGWAVARSARRPIVVDMRDAWPDLISESGVAPGRAGRALARGVTALQRRADLVVTVSERFAEILRGRGAAGGRVAAVPNGIDVATVPFLGAPAPHPGPLRVLYLGTHGVSQGLEAALRAAALAGPETVRLTLIGQGAEKPMLVERARELGAPVEFRSPVSGDALWAAYAEADSCLVHLRDWPAFRFTVPSKIYEVFAVGRHITAGLAGEAAELVAAAGGGVVVPPDDSEAMAAAWTELAARRERLDLGPAPRRWVERNGSYDALAERYLELLAGAARR